MSGICSVCSKKLPIDGAASCSSCKRFYHLDCVNLLSTDLDYMKDHNMFWQCAQCISTGRRLRSGSVCNVPVVSNSPQSGNLIQDNFERLFAELHSIKNMQQSIIDDISHLKESQVQLGNDLGIKQEKLQSEIESSNLKLANHEQLLNSHSDALSSITSKISQFERDVEQVKGVGQTSNVSDTSVLTSLQISQSEEDMLAEIAERRKPATNIIIFSVREIHGVSLVGSKADDLNYVNQLFKFLGTDPTIDSVTRVGKFAVGRIRPIKVTLQSEREVHNVINRAKKLRDATEYVGVSISFDRTPKQLARYKALRSELEERKARGERNLKIRFVSGTPKIVSLN